MLSHHVRKAENVVEKGSGDSGATSVATGRAVYEAGGGGYLTATLAAT